jgi:hypothetical protein
MGGGRCAGAAPSRQPQGRSGARAAPALAAAQVERVVAERAGVDGSVKYLIKWKGVPYSECTWETLEDTASHGGKEEVDAFLERERRLVEASNAVQYARERFKIRCAAGARAAGVPRAGGRAPAGATASGAQGGLVGLVAGRRCRQVQAS